MLLSQRLFPAVAATIALSACLLADCLHAADVEFVVGNYTEAEGGQWDPQQSLLSQPFGIDFDSQGNLYVVELGGGRIHCIDASGEVVQIAGDGSKSYQGDGGPAKNATFNGMHNGAVTADDQLLIADSWNHCVRSIDLSTGEISTLAGSGEEGFSGDGGSASDATFNFVMCISLNHDKTVLHVVDLKNRRVRNINLENGSVVTVAGNGEKGVPVDGDMATRSPLVDPRAVTSDRAGNLYILERGGHALRVVRPDGTIHTVAGVGTKGFRDGAALQSQFGSPKHVCVDDQDRVYIADDVNKAIRRFDPSTKRVETVLGRGFGDPRIKLSHPHGVCVHEGDLYVIDSGNHRILKIKIP